MGGRYAEWGWRLHLGTQSARTFGPSACQSTGSWPLCCLQAKLRATELYREKEREKGGGGWLGGLVLTLPHFSLSRQQLLCKLDLLVA